MVIKFNKEIYNEAIQKYLFSKGCKWCDGKTTVNNDLNVYSEKDNAIEFDIKNKAMSWCYASYFSKIDFTFPDDLSKIEEALKPKIEVGSYVKIVKEFTEYAFDYISEGEKGVIFQVKQIPTKGTLRAKVNGWGVSESLVELVTKEEYDAYIESKKPKLTFGGKEVTIVNDGVYCEGIKGSMTQIKDIVNNPLNKMNNFGPKSVESVHFNNDVIEQGEYTLDYLIKHVGAIKIGCTTGTIEELEAIIEAGNKLK